MSALEQAGALLDALDEHGAPISFTELVLRTGLPKSSVHGVLARLVGLGWVERAETGRYRIGLRLVELASDRLNAMDVVSRFVEVCGRRKILPNESIVLSMVVGHESLYLATRNGNRPVGVQYRIGMRLPAATTASGKAVLAAETDEAVRARFPDGCTIPGGGAGSKPVDELLDELATIRARGYSIDDEETAAGMICFGASLQGTSEGDRSCAVAISLMKASVAEGDYDTFGRDIVELARTLS